MTLFGYGQSTRETLSNLAGISSIQLKGKVKEPSIEELRKLIEAQEHKDSLRLDKILEEALKIAISKINMSRFQKDYDTTPDDDSLNVKVNILSGHLFSTNFKHLLIRRQVPGCVYIEIYRTTGTGYKNVLSTIQGGLTYIEDMIRDVNGDKQKDFLVHWYPSSGCCRRDIYDVYLYQTDKGTFTKNYEFINPTFSPAEKMIRGVAYGFPGEVGLYKYKWNGLQVDTIEFIYPNQDDKKGRTYFKTNKRSFFSKNIKKTKLKSVPKEYLKIESYEWFIDY